MDIYTQATRPMRIETRLDPDTLLLEAFECQDVVSEPYVLRCRVLCTKPNADVDSLLWSEIRVTLLLIDGSKRYFYGVVRSVRLSDRIPIPNRPQGFTVYEIEAAHRFWFLSLSTNCRIWQDKPVPEIVKQVLDPNFESDWKTVLDYPVREYCVQYNESDFAYVSRLLESEGIYYFFRNDEEKASFVLADTRAPVKPCRGTAIEFDPDPTSSLKEDVILAIERTRVAQTRKFAFNDYNFLTPRTDLRVEASTNSSPQRYDYPGKYKTVKEGERYAKLRLEAEQAVEKIFTGVSDCRDMCAGASFELTKHYASDFNTKYMLTGVHHRATDSVYRVKNGKDGEFHYSNTFAAMPADVPFRPQHVTERAHVAGSQTALVVGSEMDKPETEEHARVKLHFYWDRYGSKKGTDDSCWIRVSQPWAGRNWGTVSIPRVGQEVIVDFLEGDPDRPIITGRVYNAEMTAPYTLPAGAVNMGFKSRSIGGTGYNEISVNDTNTSEGITIHAEKDMSTVVENNETIEVRNCRTEKVVVDEKITIGNNRTEEVVANEKIKIGANRTEEVVANESIKVGNNRDTTIGSNEVLTIGMTRTQTVGINEMINIGAAQEITIGALQMVSVGVAQVITVGMKHTLNAGSQISLSAPKIILEGTEEIKLTCGGGTISINSSGVITIKGTMVLINC